MAVLIERYAVMPSKVDPSSYGLYDRLEERFIVSTVVAESSSQAYDLAWRLKDKHDKEHEEKRRRL